MHCIVFVYTPVPSCYVMQQIMDSVISIYKIYHQDFYKGLSKLRNSFLFNKNTFIYVLLKN